ncbi:hypothetical protein IF2G_05304 [Cordyceps javanica]|nr:hypothetical protein IF2G_05304 [Cordyceps javanica]
MASSLSFSCPRFSSSRAQDYRTVARGRERIPFLPRLYGNLIPLVPSRHRPCHCLNGENGKQEDERERRGGEKAKKKEGERERHSERNRENKGRVRVYKGQRTKGGNHTASSSVLHLLVS